MTSKECGHCDEDSSKSKGILIMLGSFVVLICLTIFIIWAVLRPSKPSFTIHDTTLMSFNTSSANYLSTNMQVTLSTINPNERIGIYYQKLDVYATYRSQQITLPTLLPTQYLGHKDSTVWSPFLQGDDVPVSPYLVAALNQDEHAGLVLVNIKVTGKVKWKVGTWISGNYHLDVNCPAYITFGKNNGMAIGPATKYNMELKCNVEVWL